MLASGSISTWPSLGTAHGGKVLSYRNEIPAASGLLIAALGVADEWIASGAVQLNGVPVIHGAKIEHREEDVLTVHGHRVKQTWQDRATSTPAHYGSALTRGGRSVGLP